MERQLFYQNKNQFTLLTKIISSFLAFIMVFSSGTIACYAMGLGIPEKIELESVLSEYIEEIIDLDEIKSIDSENTADNEIYFNMKDETTTVYSFSEPVTYIDENGNLKCKDNSIVEQKDKEKKDAGYDYSNGQNDYRINFSSDSSKGVLVEYENISFSLAPISEIVAPGYVSNGEINNERFENFEYADLFGENTALKYFPQINGIKEIITLDNKIDVNIFSSLLKTNGCEPVINEDGSVSLISSETGEEVQNFTAPFAFDKDYTEGIEDHHFCADCFYELEKISDNEYILSVTVSDEWLNSENTVYPVTIDPTTSNISNHYDAGVYSAKSANNYGSEQTCCFGRASEYGYGRVYTHFTMPTAISKYATINSAYIWERETTGRTTTTYVTPYMVTASWSETAITWSNKAAYNSSTAMTKKTINSKSTDDADNPYWYKFDIKTAVKKWVDGTTNYGLVFISNEETNNAYNWRAFTSRSYSSSAMRPYTVINYTNDTTAPTAPTVTGNPTSWTNASVTLTASSTDAASGVAYYSFSTTKGSYTWQTAATKSVTANTTYYVYAKDKAGNISSPTTVAVSKIDKTVPTAPTVTGNPTSWTNANVTLTASSTDAASGVAYYSFSTTAGTYSWQTAATKSVTANTTYYVYAKDTAGNISSATTVTVSKIDKTKPTAPTVTGNPTSWTNANATLTASSTDAASGIAYYSFSTTAGTYSWQTAATKSVTANTTYYVYAKDTAGNISSATTVTVSKIDKTKPTAPTVTGNPTSWTNANVTLTASSTDIGSDVTNYSFSTTKGTYSWQTAATKSVTANTTYYVYAKDSAGNISDPTTVVVNKIDKTKPAAPTVTGNPANWTNANVTLTASSTDNASGVAYYSFSTTAGTYSWQTSATKTVTTNATYYVYAKDAAGNISTATTVTVGKIDKTVPTAPTVTGNPTSWTNSNVTLTAKSTDTDSDIAYYSFSTAKGSYTWQTAATKSVTANTTYYVYAKDTAGNISEPTTVTVSKIDKTKPAAPTVTCTPSSWTNGSVTLKASTTDTGSGVYYYSFSTAKGSYTWQTSASKIIEENGTYYVYAKDKAGNISDLSTIVVDTIDKAAPVISDITVFRENYELNVTVMAEDAPAEGGFNSSGIKQYSFDNGRSWQTDNHGKVNCYLKELTVIVKDNAGNITSETIEFSFPEFYEDGSLIGLMNSDSDDKIQYKIGEDDEWKDYTAPFSVPAFETTTVYTKFENSSFIYCKDITSNSDYYGVYSENIVDFTLEYQNISFDFTRHYDSVDRNWFFCVDSMVMWPTMDLFEASMPDGRKLTFIKQDDSTFVNEFTGCTLNIIDDSHIEITDEDITYVYEGYVLTAIKNNKYGDTITIKRTLDNIYISDETGRSYVLGLSKYGKILTVTDPENGVINYSYNTDDSINTVVDQTGVTIAHYSYDDRRIIKSMDKTINYTENGRVDSIEYDSGAYVNYSYDDEHLTISTTSSVKTTTSETYNDAFFVVSSTDEDGNTTEYTYDEYFRIAAETSNGKTVIYTYDENGNVLSEISDEETNSYYVYDENGNLIRQQTGNNYTYYVYNEIGEVILSAGLQENYTGTIPSAYIDGLNCFDVTKYSYENGLVVKSTSDDETIVYEYDKYGNSIKTAVSKTENGETTVSVSVNTYDLLGNLLTAANGDETSSYIYDAAGRILLANENGECTRTLYDSCGRIIQEISPEDYDASKDGLPNENTYADSKAGHTYEYNDKNQLVSETSRLNKTTKYSYNDIGNKIREEFDIYKFYYLDHGELEQVKIDDVTVVSYNYDENYNLLSEEYANDDAVRYEYNSNGDVTAQYHNSNSKPYVTYTYNSDNELTEKINTDTGLKYVYGENGQVSIYRISDNTLIQSYAETEMKADEENGTEGFKTITETHFGTAYTSVVKEQSVSFTSDQNTIEYSYQTSDEEDDKKITSDVVKSNSATVLSSSYDYDDNSNITKKSVSYNEGVLDFVNSYDAKDRITATTAFGNAINYTYDADSQLLSAQGENYNASYTYDARGNITSKTVHEETTEFIYSNTGWNDLLVEVNGNELSYDANGNVLTYGEKEYTWNTGRHLESITDDENTYSYTYDENGIRTSKTINGVTTYYNTSDGVILSQTDGTNTMYFQYDNSRTPFGFICNNIQYFYITNQMGDIIGITDINGSLIAQYFYDEWGKLLSVDANGENLAVANANPLRYRGYYYDSETGYYYLQSRYYDAEICRFINADVPEIAKVSKEVESGVNIFAYCNNDSINNEDFTGFLTKWAAAAYLVVFVAYYVSKLIKNAKSYTFEASRIIIDNTGLCVAKIKYYKSKWLKKSFEVVLGDKKAWGNRTNINNNLNMMAIKYHANQINSLMSKTGTSKFTTADGIQANIYSFFIACYLINAGIRTAAIKYQYTLMWDKYCGKFAYATKNVILCRIFRGGSLNGWYYFW